MNLFETDEISFKPISNIDDLINLKEIKKRNVKKLNPIYYDINESNQIIVCHDMRNNYLEDKYYNGFNSANCYSFYNWNQIDLFIYFSHHFITIPPPTWIDAAHENNTRILGTFITEFTDGEKLCEKFFSNIDLVIQRLLTITKSYEFDGWLINIENKVLQVDKLKYFLNKLKLELDKLEAKRYKVIWYDSVIETGELKWQNELNEMNKNFFNLSDGFFVNYTWKDENLTTTKLNSVDRWRNVYVGVDVFGRGCLGNGGFNCNIAFEEIYKHNLSYALFAPGWIHECNDPEYFYSNSDKFWMLLNKYTFKRKIRSLPLITNFSHASSKYYYINGYKSKSDWNNLTLQSLMPIITDNNNLSWCFEDGYYSGNCILLESGSSQCLFDLEININHDDVYLLEYVFKNDIDISLDYFMIDDNIKKCFKSCENSNDYKLIKLIKEELKYDWKLIRVVFKFEKNILLTGLNLLNNSNSNLQAKIGLIRLMKYNEFNNTIIDRESIHFKRIKLASIIDYKTKIFLMNNQIYLCIKLEWDIISEEVKYYNLYLNKNRNNSLSKFNEEGLQFIACIVGKSYSLCLKMNENIFLDSTNACVSNTNLSFNMMLHVIDKHMNNLYEGEKLFDINSSSIDSESVKFIKINLNNLKCKDETNSSFLSDIIYDLEFF